MHSCFRSQHTQNYQTNRIFTLLLWSLNLIVHHGFLPVILMGPKNFKYLRSTEQLYLERVVGFANFAQPQLPI